ncbi:16S rRNA (uracil(1498)-N(3))-methyltransferase [Dyella sp.]|jgi:16S rRNA (uracil1498-N3)-methyltransferase|uniref:16S rRNA (uracil(1498)-N(3))-methyltransferase n=1 Tax=Dyella sp. TaxID=1869338 RepID=UPI002D76F8D7|nr:16S rRNA (uracil(1498)-N(3))-methyltransferase [Dyella sp.]HET6433255.1 16S rRNA (uracil(1498)-N(3))-methyltransferase [Dyella sp.]
MRTIRIHVEQTLVPGHTVTLPAQAGEHVARVLRLGVGQPLVLFNGDGHDYAATIVAVDKRQVSVSVGDRWAVQAESSLPLVLAQGLARGEKMDLIVQKATELGVQAIVPLLTERSEVKLDPSRAAKRLEHWQAVIASACEQSGRACLPTLCGPLPLARWLESLDPQSAALRLALLPGGSQRAGELAPTAAGAILVVGPEGGLGERDVALLEKHGFAGLRLGPRILRTETAGLAALAALQALHGDL